LVVASVVDVGVAASPAVLLADGAAPGTAATATTSPAASATQRWSGTGDRVLGTVRLTPTSTIRWSSTGKRFSITDNAVKLNVIGNG